jgi:hypothetical protein
VAEEKKRVRLPVLSGSSDVDAPPRSPAYVVLVSAAATLFAWTLLAALLNGLLGRALARAGIVAAANLVVLLVTAAAGGAIAIAIDARAPVRRARYAGLVAAAAGWTVSFLFTVVSRVPTATELLTWLLILLVLSTVATIGASIGHTLTSMSRKAKSNS